MNSFRSVRKRSTFGRRSAFTLVELLVVIVIIGILVALLIPTIGAAMSAAKVGRMGVELGQITSSLEAYKTEMGAYPPDFANADAALDIKQMTNHMARKFRNRQPQDQSQFDVTGLDPAEALVFWLYGFSKDAKFPLARREALDPTAAVRIPLKGTNPFFDFDQSRLMDKDGDGYPEYYPQDSEMPYVYVRNDNYGVETAPGSGMFAANLIPVLNGNVSIRAYAAQIVGTAVQRFAEPEKFQIICAGLDGEFGAGAISQLAVYPDGIGYAESDEDNLTNFSGGKTLEDAIP